jgi:hypothetical protein
MTFRLAPMSPGLRVLTWALMLLPCAFALATVVSPPVGRAVLGTTTALVVLSYALVGLAFRPTRFEVDDAALRIVWPVRSREIPRADVEAARRVDAAAFRAEFGLGARVGAGGLWGGFGLLKTRSTTFSMWISRTDAFVIVRLRGARPLLLTPDDPDGFVRALAP